jgi:hypothetical protein
MLLLSPAIAAMVTNARLKRSAQTGSEPSDQPGPVGLPDGRIPEPRKPGHGNFLLTLKLIVGSAGVIAALWFLDYMVSG